MGNLNGKRIAITGSRKMSEMSVMVEKKGGMAFERPLQETVKCSPEEMRKEIEGVIENGTDWSIFTTGIGTATVFEAADSLGLLDSFVQAIKASSIASRGYKTVQALKKYGLHPEVIDGDGTNAGLINALDPIELGGKNVFLQLHGERVPLLENSFLQKGAFLSLVLPYKTTVPRPEIVSKLVDEVIGGEIDAVLFTATPQVRVLFQEARVRGLSEQLAVAFNEKAIAGSVGKVTTSTLKEYGVERIIAPEMERMGALVVAIDDFYKANELI